MIFNAQITEGFSSVTGNLIFDQVDVNIGEAFKASSGVFEVPISGIYRMTFSGQTAFISSACYVGVYKKDGSRMLTIFDENNAYGANNLSYTWIVKLDEGDELKLYTENYLFAANTFTEELIHID